MRIKKSELLNNEKHAKAVKPLIISSAVLSENKI